MTKSIELAYGLCALIDDEDYDLVHRYHWHLHPHDATCYARTQLTAETVIHGEVKAPGQKIFLHRLILPPRWGRAHNAELPNQTFVIDHQNGRGYDCRRSNLRWATFLENTRNTHPCEWHSVIRRPDNRWSYRLDHQTAGDFRTAFDAALAYDRLLRILHPQDADRLCHFPPFEAPPYVRSYSELPKNDCHVV